MLPRVVACLVVVVLCACASVRLSEQERQASQQQPVAQGNTLSPILPVTEPAAAKNSSTGERATTWSEWFRSSPPADWALVLIGVITAIAAIYTLKLLVRQLVANEEAAKAAKVSADAVMLAERGYLRIDPAPLQQWRNWPSIEPTSIVNVENRGNTPVRVTEVVVALHLNQPELLPADPNQIVADARFGRPDSFLLPKDSFGVVSEFDRFREETWHRFRYGRGLHMWLLAYADYVDMFGMRRRRGVAFMMETFDGEFDHEYKPGYNYDRLRIRGEGRDWD